MIRISILFIIFHLLPIGLSTPVQSTPLHTSKNDSLKIGLVLSGGGAKGIVHIGVLQALEEAGVKIDYITGTSMGSLVGGLYSIGYTTDQLVEIAKSNNWQDLFSEREDRRYISNFEKTFDSRTIVTFPITGREIELPLGIITGQNIYTFLSRLTWPVHGTDDFENFPIPFAAVATVLETGQAKVFKSGYLPDAIRASISVPSVMVPHSINDTLYIDGGLARNLPVEDVIEMGANYVIAVDVSNPLLEREELSDFRSIMNQIIGYRIFERNRQSAELADLVVLPDSLLDGFTMSDFNKTEELLKIGQEVGAMYLDDFHKIAEMQNQPANVRSGVGSAGALPINNVIVTGNTLLDDDYILRQLEFTPGARLSPELIEDKVTRLFSSRFYERVTYRIIPDSLYFYNLQVDITEDQKDAFRIGLRYESRTQASILLETTFRNLLHRGSLTKFDVRLGDVVNIKADHIYYGALGSRLALLTTVEYRAENVDWYIDQIRTSRFRNETYRGEISAGNYFATQNLVSIGIRKDFTAHKKMINEPGIEPTSTDYHTLFGRFHTDTFHRKAFPKAGQKLLLEGFYSSNVVLSPIEFTTASLLWKGAYAISDVLSLKNTVYGGYTISEQLPWDYWFSPNRMNQTNDYIRFGGYERYELTSKNIQMVSLGAQIEPFYHRFINFDLYAGRFTNNWNLDFTGTPPLYGASASIGALTILGPVQAILSTSTDNPLQAELQIGFQF